MESAAGQSSKILDRLVDGPRAWTRATIGPDRWSVRLSRDCLDELDAVIARLRRTALPTVLVDPTEFELAACRKTMQRVRDELADGTGFVVLDRLPIERYSKDEAVALHWLLGSLVARPVAQSTDGRMIYDVRDIGKSHGGGVRGDSTNVELNFHTDNCYNTIPPEVFALLCLRGGISGGVSRTISFYSVHNALTRHHHNVLPRLYQPFYFDRQCEHAADEPSTIHEPILAYDEAGDSLTVRFSIHLIRWGHQIAGTEIDDAGEQALGAWLKVLADPGLWAEFTLEPGQIEYTNNHSCGHARTAFEDAEDPEQRRHMVRLWLRDRGQRFYGG